MKLRPFKCSWVLLVCLHWHASIVIGRHLANMDNKNDETLLLYEYYFYGCYDLSMNATGCLIPTSSVMLATCSFFTCTFAAGAICLAYVSSNLPYSYSSATLLLGPIIEMQNGKLFGCLSMPRN